MPGAGCVADSDVVPANYHSVAVDEAADAVGQFVDAADAVFARSNFFDGTTLSLKPRYGTVKWADGDNTRICIQWHGQREGFQYAGVSEDKDLFVFKAPRKTFTWA